VSEKQQLTVAARIADELGVPERQVTAAVELLDGGATVPFIARYRKEVTGALDDAQLRMLEERLRYLRELEERRAAVLDSVRAQGKLDPELETQILAADSKARLEDVYLPYKPKRRTKAQIAREQGLEPLADQLLTDPTTDPAAAAEAYVTEEVADVGSALDGARAILAERFGEDADLIGELREQMWSRGQAVSRVREGREQVGAKYADYFEFAEALVKLPSHRILALFRGEKEEVLDVELDPADAAPTGAGPGPYEARIAERFGVADQGRAADRWLADTVRWAWRTRLLVRLDLDLRGRLRQRAEEEATRVFANNLRDLLLAAPAGARPVLGLDPGFRTGVRPGRGPAVPVAGRGRRGLCERGRRRCQHGLGPAAGAGVWDQRRAGHRGGGPPGRGRGIPHPPGAARGAPARPQGVRAVRWLPAHPRWRRPAGQFRRAP